MLVYCMSWSSGWSVSFRGAIATSKNIFAKALWCRYQEIETKCCFTVNLSSFVLQNFHFGMLLLNNWYYWYSRRGKTGRWYYRSQIYKLTFISVKDYSKHFNQNIIILAFSLNFIVFKIRINLYYLLKTSLYKHSQLPSPINFWVVVITNKLLGCSYFYLDCKFKKYFRI